MAQNRVQYQRGLSMPEFFDTYGSVQRCEALVRAWRWPDGFNCPRCQSSWHSEFRRQDRLYFQCSGCRYQCSLLSGTIFEGSKLALPTWFLAMHLMTQAKNNVSALELKRHLGVSYPTAWLLKHKLMQLMVDREQGRQLTGRVEIDDAYLGGEVHGEKAGRGSPNKIPFVAAVQTTESGQAILMCLSQRPFTKESIRDFAQRSLAAPATLVCDGLGCFSAVRGMGILHEPHVTGQAGWPASRTPPSSPSTRCWATSKRPLQAPITRLASGSTRIDTLVRCNTCSTVGSICARSCNDSHGQHLRPNRARCAPVGRLSHLADQVVAWLLLRLLVNATAIEDGEQVRELQRRDFTER